MKPFPSFLGFLFLAGAFFPVASLAEGSSSEWTETVYFAPKWKADKLVPKPAPEWKIYRQQQISTGAGVTRIEESGDPGRPPRTIWVTPAYVVELGAGSSPTITRPQDSPYASAGKPDIGWTRNLDPLDTLDSDGGKVLVYDHPQQESGYLQRYWIDAETRQVLALSNGRFITLYSREKSSPSALSLSGEAQAALSAYVEQSRKDSRRGSMP